MIYSLHSHPDKVMLAINQTMDEVAAKFVESPKYTNRQFGYYSATPPLFTFLPSSSPTQPFVKTTKSMVTPMAVKRCLCELLSPSH